jgi:hypothetical protein
MDANASRIEIAVMLIAVILPVALCLLYLLAFRRRRQQLPLVSFLDVIGRKYVDNQNTQRDS